MTREEARQGLEGYALFIADGTDLKEALSMAIEALKAHDRPIICPRCGRTFAESEGRERDK